MATTVKISQLVSATDPIPGTSLIPVVESGTTVKATLQQIRNVITPEDYGAVGDGVANDTVALQAALTALSAGDTLEMNGNYKINASLTITDKTRIRITGKGRVFLSGAASGAYIFQLVGTCDDIEIDGLTLVGENNSGYGQTAIGAASGQTISNTRFHDLNITQINVGISLNAFPSGTWTRAMVYANILKDIPGTVSGSGYGIHIPNTTDSHIFDNTIENCDRHSIYQASGTNCNNVIANNVIRKHRFTTGDGSFRSAAVIARSSNVSFIGNKFSQCKDCCLEIAHVTSDSANCTNVLVEGNSFTNRANAVHTILVGEQAVPTSYATTRVTIRNNTFDDNLSVTAALPPNIYILNGSDIYIENNTFIRRNVTSSLSGVILAGDDTYLNANSQIANISVRNNTAISDATAGTAGFVNICEQLATGDSYYWVKDNIAKNWPKMITWENTDDPPTGAVTPTNVNSFLKFRINVTYNFGSISANDGAVYAATVDGCKPTTTVWGRPVYSTNPSTQSYTFYAKDDAVNAAVIQVVNVSTSPSDPDNQTFVLTLEDIEPYFG
jgi:hypothetical protein